MATQVLTLKMIVDAANADSMITKCTRALNEMGLAYNTLEVKTRGAASSMNSLGNTNLGGLNNQLGMTCDKVFGVGLAVNAVTGAFKALVGQWRHALDVQLELVAAERLLRVATEDGGAAFDWVKHSVPLYWPFGLSACYLASRNIHLHSRRLRLVFCNLLIHKELCRSLLRSGAWNAYDAVSAAA